MLALTPTRNSGEILNQIVIKPLSSQPICITSTVADKFIHVVFMKH